MRCQLLPLLFQTLHPWVSQKQRPRKTSYEAAWYRSEYKSLLLYTEVRPPGNTLMDAFFVLQKKLLQFFQTKDHKLQKILEDIRINFILHLSYLSDTLGVMDHCNWYLWEPGSNIVDFAIKLTTSGVGKEQLASHKRLFDSETWLFSSLWGTPKTFSCFAIALTLPISSSSCVVEDFFLLLHPPFASPLRLKTFCFCSLTYRWQLFGCSTFPQVALSQCAKLGGWVSPANKIVVPPAKKKTSSWEMPKRPPPLVISIAKVNWLYRYGSLRTAAILSSISCSHYHFLHKLKKNYLCSAPITLYRFRTAYFSSTLKHISRFYKHYSKSTVKTLRMRQSSGYQTFLRSYLRLRVWIKKMLQLPGLCTGLRLGSLLLSPKPLASFMKQKPAQDKANEAYTRTQGSHGAMPPSLLPCNKVFKSSFQTIIFQTNNGCSAFFHLF